jgi:hypothetical protein
MEEKKYFSKKDLEASVDIVYETIHKKGVNKSHEANHQLMDTINELGLKGRESTECWNGLWKRHKKDLEKLGYAPGY